MGLRAKFNLAILAAFLVGFSGAAILLQRLFVENARTQVLENARIMMSAADAIRHFADVQIGPIAAGQNDVLNGRFIAASVPSFAAQTTFKAIQARYPDFAYREPTLNPTNLDDRPADWEADYINAFRNNLTTQELIGERDTPTGRVLSLARPIAVNSADCLSCHSTPARAPTAMLATYGSDNGFGWQLHEIVGAQVVTVPMSLPLQQANQLFMTFMGLLLAVFLLIIVILNILLHYMVIKPVVKVARIANAVSLGELDVEEYEKPGRDEISVLSAAFNRMRRSLDSALNMIAS
jgi:HAMP domain-containing protein